MLICDKQRLLTRVILGIILLLCLVALAFAHRQISFYNQPIFDFSQTSTWKANRNYIYYSSDDFSPDVLKSYARWKNFSLNLNIINPLIFEIAYDIQYDGNYRFFIVNRTSKVLISGHSINDVHHLDHVWPLQLPDGDNLVLPLTFEVDESKAVLQIGKDTIASVDRNGGETQFGLCEEQAHQNTNIFFNVSVTGKLENGQNANLGPIIYQNYDLGTQLLRFWQVPGILFVCLSYILIIGFILVLKNGLSRHEYSLNIRSCFSNDKILTILYFLVGLSVFVKVWQLGHKALFPLSSWQTMPYLFFVLVTDIILFCISYFYASALSLSPLILFVSLPFFLYFLQIINMCTFNFQNPFFLRFWIVLLALPIFFISKDYLIGIRVKISSLFKFDKYAGLILLWVIYIVLYFLEYNFRSSRPLYGDEATLWFISARDMIQEGVFKAHLESYPGGGQHPFGIEYLAAIPGILWGINKANIIYFMPLFNILVITFFLIKLRQKPCLFLFFYVMSFVFYDYAGVFGALFFRVVFGEGLSGIFFLVLGAEIFWLVRQGKIMELRCWVALCAACGLMLLTKKPTYYWGSIFLLTAAIFYLRNGWTFERIRNLTIGLVVFCLPFAAWKLLTSKYDMGMLTTSMIIRSYGHIHFNAAVFDWGALKQYACVNDLIFYIIFGAILISVVFLRGIERLHLIPPLTLILFVTAYYFFGFQTDWYYSSARYYMPPVLLIFFLAGNCLEDFMQKSAEASVRLRLLLSGTIGLVLIFGMFI